MNIRRILHRTLIVALSLATVGTWTVGPLSTTTRLVLLSSGSPTHRRLTIACADAAFVPQQFGICTLDYSRRLPSQSKSSTAALVWNRYLKVIVSRTAINAKSHEQGLVIRFPLIPLFLLFAAYPFIAFIRGPLRRYRRRRKGLCVTCGYDLTGLPENRCPECGTEFER